MSAVAGLALAAGGAYFWLTGDEPGRYLEFRADAKVALGVTAVSAGDAQGFVAWLGGGF